MAGSGAKWTGSSTNPAVVGVDWSTEYSGDETALQVQCHFDIDPNDTASRVAKKLLKAFNLVAQPPREAVIDPNYPETVEFLPADQVEGMIANGHVLGDGQPWTIAGMTVQQIVGTGP